jgi:hypothetical protein
MAEKNCAVCGNSYKGIGNSCKDGSYCDACSKKLRLVCREDDAEFMSASQIREMLNRYASEIEAYDTVQKPETCPFCGKKLPKLLNLRMLDAYICADCGNRAAEMLHTGYGAIGYKCFSEIAPLFSQAAVQGGKEDASGRFHDADALRIVYPLIRTLLEDPEGGYDVAYIDPLDSLSDAELRAAEVRAEQRREALKTQYGEHKALFEVDDITKLYNESKGHRTYRNEYRIAGRVLLGSINRKDTAAVTRAEGAQSFRIQKLGDSRKYSNDLKEVKEGAEGGLFIEGTVSCIYPGDILLID